MLLNQLKIHFPGLAILFISMILGILIHADYGISWDEPSQRNIGMKSWGYMFKGDKSYEGFYYKEYGVAFEVPLIQLEKLMGLEDPADIYRMRHLIAHFFFLFSAFVFYLLIWFLYKNRLLAITGYLMLLLSPRIFAHSFFNTKDITFMGMFILCLFLAALAFARKKPWYFLVYGILTGLLVNIRIMGILLPAVTVMFLLIDLVTEKNRSRLLASLLIYLVSAASILILTWPYLWSDPAGNFGKAFASMSKYRWDNYILMFGEFVRSTRIPWWYFPSWFVITTPVIYFIAGISGILVLIVKFLRSPIRFLVNTPERNQMLYFICFIAPVGAVIHLHSVLYDTWRQLFFIYPMFLLMAVYGLFSLSNGKSSTGSLFKVAASVLILLSFVNSAWFMIRNHPYQDVYFNHLVSHREEFLRKNFEMNFWGNAYNKALENILQNDNRERLYIMAANMPGEHNLMLMPERDRKRVVFVYSLARANYFMTNYRWHPGDYCYLPYRQYCTINVLNSSIISVWKLQ
jgi:hypothetical protein